MVIHKIWIAKTGPLYAREERSKEGWFLFGFIPLYVRTLNLKH